MRHSSMKSIVAALSITITLLAAAPAASARVQSARDGQATTREADRNTDRFAGVRQLINRALRRLANNTGIVIPTPAPSTNG